MQSPFSCYLGIRLRRIPVRGHEGRDVYTEGVYIWVVGRPKVACDPLTPTPPAHLMLNPDSTTPPHADLTKTQLW